MASLMDDRYHYIRNGDGREELFDLSSDPDERHDLSQTAEMRPTLERFRARLGTLMSGASR